MSQQISQSRVLGLTTDVTMVSASQFYGPVMDSLTVVQGRMRERSCVGMVMSVQSIPVGLGRVYLIGGCVMVPRTVQMDLTRELIVCRRGMVRRVVRLSKDGFHARMGLDVSMLNMYAIILNNVGMVVTRGNSVPSQTAPLSPVHLGV